MSGLAGQTSLFPPEPAPDPLLCWLWLAVGLRFVLPWGIPLKLPRPESAPLAAAADTVQELGELPLLPPAPAQP